MNWHLHKPIRKNQGTGVSMSLSAHGDAAPVKLCLSLTPDAMREIGGEKGDKFSLFFNDGPTEALLVLDPAGELTPSQLKHTFTFRIGVVECLTYEKVKRQDCTWEVVMLAPGQLNGEDQPEDAEDIPALKIKIPAALLPPPSEGKPKAVTVPALGDPPPGRSALFQNNNPTQRKGD